MLSIIIATLLPFSSIFNYQELEQVQGSGHIIRYIKSIVETQIANDIKSQVIPFILLIYFAGIIFLIIKECIAYIRLFILLSRAKKVKKDGYTLCLVNEDNLSPFSWSSFIVFQEDQEIESPILVHEIFHTQSKHWVDILILDIFCIFTWYNPFSWVIKSLAKLNHEFEADNKVIRGGVDIHEYQRMLIFKAIEIKSFTITNNFSLKESQFRKRVLQMNREDTGRSHWIAILGLPSIILSLIIISTPATATLLSNIADYTVKQLPFIRKDIPIKLTDEKNVLPEYAGGYDALYQLLYDNIQFPEALITESGINKKVVINLSITEQGEISDLRILQSPGMDIENEIRRVLNLTKGKWQPATIEGHSVKSTINLPITFSTM